MVATVMSCSTTKSFVDHGTVHTAYSDPRNNYAVVAYKDILNTYPTLNRHVKAHALKIWLGNYYDASIRHEKNWEDQKNKTLGKIQELIEEVTKQVNVRATINMAYLDHIRPE